MRCGYRARIMEWQNVRMAQSRRRLDLPREAARTDECAEERVEDLERDEPLVTEVACQVDRCHAAAPQLPLDRVAPGERGREPSRHRHRRRINNRLRPGRVLDGRSLEEVIRRDRRHREQRLDLAPQRHVTGAYLGEIRPALGRRARECPLQDGVDRRPPIRCQRR